MGKTFLEKGEIKQVDLKARHDFKFPSATSFFSAASNLLPAISGISGSRVTLGVKSFLQAIPLVYRETPLVNSINEADRNTFTKTLSKKVAALTAEDAGVISYIDDDEIRLKKVDGKEEIYYLYQHYTLGNKSELHHTTVVKVGDKVKVGDLLAKSNYTDNKGNLALGVNLTTALMPYKGFNFEDGIVVSEAGAKKLAAEQVFKIRVEKRLGLEANKNKYISLFSNKFFNAQLSNIDSDGVVKRGVKVKTGDPLILAFTPRSIKSTDQALGKLSKGLRQAFRDASEVWEYDSEGEVQDVSKTSNLITVTIKTARPLRTGDKLSTATGNKGVVTKIISDTETPTTSDGKSIELLMNPMGVVSRVSPSYLSMMALGKVAKKKGKSLKVTAFHLGSSIDETIKYLKTNNVEEMEDVHDPTTGTTSKVFVGPGYYTRLGHSSEDKESHAGDAGTFDWAGQPSKVGEDSPKRIGNLATTALLANNAKAVLADATLIRSTKNDEYWRRLKLGQPLPTPETPFVFKKFISQLKGAGINVQEKNDSFKLLPQTDANILELSKGKIENPLTFKVKKDELVFEKGGLFDPEKVGILGNVYNHIELNHAVPNPISEDNIRRLLSVTKDQYNESIKSGTIRQKLESVNIETEIRKNREYLKTKKKTGRDDALKNLQFLQTLKDNKIEAKDLLLSKVPIIPAQYRPISYQGGLVLTSDVNNLYKDLMLNNQALENTEDLPTDIVDRVRSKQYDAVKAIYGLGDPITTKNQQKNVKGLLAEVLGIKGGSAKASTFQSRIVGKPTTLTGRGVLSMDSSLDLDQAKIPHNIAWKMYSPFVNKRLVQKGVPATKAMEYIKAKNPLALMALQEEMRDRPLQISRDPQLHKFSNVGFFPLLNEDSKDTTIKLNQLIYKGMGADADGDAVGLHVPASDAAKEEIKEKMLPSTNIMSSKTFSPIHIPSNEAALGLYDLSTKKSDRTIKKFKNIDEIEKAYHAGELALDDNVEIG